MNKKFTWIFGLLDEEIEKSQIILMKKNNIKNLLPVHCNLLLTINTFEKSPIIVDVANKLLKSKATIGTVIKTLVAKNYLHLKPSSKDKRSKNIILTKKGQTMVKLLSTIWEKHTQIALQNLNQKEKENLIKIATLILENLHQYNQVNQNKIIKIQKGS